MKKLLIGLLALTLTLGVGCKKDQPVKVDEHANIKAAESGKNSGNHVMNTQASPGRDLWGHELGHYCTWESTYDNYQMHHPCVYFCRCSSCITEYNKQYAHGGAGGDMGNVIVCTYYSAFHN